MRTTSYNSAKEIKIGILLVVFTVSVFTAIRVKELQVNETTDANQTRSGQISIDNTSIPAMPTPGARLIDEPAPKLEPLIKATEYKAAKFVETEMAIEKERFLNSNNGAVEAEPWISIPEYKASDFVNAEMAIESERFLNSNNEAVEAESVLSTESWMNSEYNARTFVEADMRNEIEKFQNSNAVAEDVLLIEPLMAALEYKPAIFVEAEITHEIEKWMGTETYWVGNFTPDINAQTTQNESKLSFE